MAVAKGSRSCSVRATIDFILAFAAGLSNRGIYPID